MGIFNGAAGGGTFGYAVGGNLGEAVGINLGDQAGVRCLVGTTLGAVADLCTSVGGIP